MAIPIEPERIREKLVDCFMRDLDGMLDTQRNKWVVYGSQEYKPLGFYDSFMDARANASVEFGFSTPFLIRQVTEDYRTHGRNGKSSYGVKKKKEQRDY